MSWKCGVDDGGNDDDEGVSGEEDDESREKTPARFRKQNRPGCGGVTFRISFFGHSIAMFRPSADLDAAMLSNEFCATNATHRDQRSVSPSSLRQGRDPIAATLTHSNLPVVSRYQ